MTSWLSQEERLAHGAYNVLLQDMEVNDICAFINHLGIEPRMFHELVNHLEPYLEPQPTFFRKNISTGERVAITLKYLAHGCDYPTLSELYCVGRSTISKIVPEVCDAILCEFVNETIQPPGTRAAWFDVAEDFQKEWNFPRMGSMCEFVVQSHVVPCSTTTRAITE